MKAGDFTRGEPLIPDDRGFLESKFYMIPAQNQVIIDFQHEVAQLAVTREQALNIVQTIRDNIKEGFGSLAYSPVEIPVRVFCDSERHIVRIALPSPASTIIARPEVILILADHIEAEAGKLLDA